MLYLRSLGLTEDETDTLLKILDLLQGKTAACWQYSESERVTAVLFDPQVEGSADLRQLTADGAIPIRIAREDADSGIPTGSGLCLDAPIRVMNLCDVLDAVSVQHSVFKKYYFAAALRDLLHPGAGALRYRISCGGSPSLTLAPKDRTYSWPHGIELLDQFLTQPVTVERAADEPAAIDVRPLDELLWFVGSRSGHGEALPWVELNEPYQLLRWPSMAALRGVPGWPRLAALWFARPSTLRDMLIISGLPRGEVIDFLNACLMCQHARAVQSAAVNQPAQAGKPNPDPRFSKVRTRLGIADGASLGHESERV